MLRRTVICHSAAYSPCPLRARRLAGIPPPTTVSAYNPSESHDCFRCDRTLILSEVSCTHFDVHTGLYVCAHHCKRLCDCPPHTKVLKVFCTLEDIDALIARVRQRLRAPDIARQASSAQLDPVATPSPLPLLAKSASAMKAGARMGGMSAASATMNHRARTRHIKHTQASTSAAAASVPAATGAAAAALSSRRSVPSGGSIGGDNSDDSVVVIEDGGDDGAVAAAVAVAARSIVLQHAGPRNNAAFSLAPRDAVTGYDWAAVSHLLCDLCLKSRDECNTVWQATALHLSDAQIATALAMQPVTCCVPCKIEVQLREKQWDTWSADVRRTPAARW